MSFKFPAASMTSEDVKIQLMAMKALSILGPLSRLSSESLVLKVGSQTRIACSVSGIGKTGQLDAGDSTCTTFLPNMQK